MGEPVCGRCGGPLAGVGDGFLYCAKCEVAGVSVQSHQPLTLEALRGEFPRLAEMVAERLQAPRTTLTDADVEALRATARRHMEERDHYRRCYHQGHTGAHAEIDRLRAALAAAMEVVEAARRVRATDDNLPPGHTNPPCGPGACWECDLVRALARLDARRKP